MILPKSALFKIRSGATREQKSMMRRTLTSDAQGKTLSLLTPQEIQESGGIERYKFLDASFHLPNSGRSARDEFGRIPRIARSRFFDHELIADTHYKIMDRGGVKLGHMQPDLVTFKTSMQNLGIERDDHLVVYDSLGIFSSPRAAWLLNSYGHPKVSVLDGGLPRWIKENGSQECEVLSVDAPTASLSEYDMKDFEEDWARQQVISYDDLVRNFKSTPEADRLSVLDARPHGRFLGTDPEPRPGISSGHIPYSISLPFTSLLTTPKEPEEPYRKYLKPDELEKIFLERFNHDREKWEGIKLGKSGLVVSCGSGMTACVIWLALHLCGARTQNLKLYDESWTGYALRDNAVIHTSSSV